MTEEAATVARSGRTVALHLRRFARATRTVLGISLGCWASAFARAAAVPVIFRTAPGRFEVAAADLTAARVIVGAAEDAWRFLAAPLGLPEAFSSPIFVRLVPALDWTGSQPFRAYVEPGGVVSLSIAWAETQGNEWVHRALVESLLIRLTVALRGAGESNPPPRWLEEGCLGLWRMRSDPAQVDALKFESGKLSPIPIDTLLRWSPTQPVSRDVAVSATWLITFLQSESTKAGEWQGFLRKLLRGEEPQGALAASFPDRFASVDERELWWQTGWHHLRRVRALPALEAVESRNELESLRRFVIAIDETDAALPMRVVLGHSREPFVQAELGRRMVALDRILPVLHPFFRNAGVSLSQAFASRNQPAAKRDLACQTFDRDWRDALELTTTAANALDELEKAPASDGRP